MYVCMCESIGKLKWTEIFPSRILFISTKTLCLLRGFFSFFSYFSLFVFNVFVCAVLNDCERLFMQQENCCYMHLDCNQGDQNQTTHQMKPNRSRVLRCYVIRHEHSAFLALLTTSDGNNFASVKFSFKCWFDDCFFSLSADCRPCLLCIWPTWTANCKLSSNRYTMRMTMWIRMQRKKYIKVQLKLLSNLLTYMTLLQFMFKHWTLARTHTSKESQPSKRVHDANQEYFSLVSCLGR